jgi:hypothetical protein
MGSDRAVIPTLAAEHSIHGRWNPLHRELEKTATGADIGTRVGHERDEPACQPVGHLLGRIDYHQIDPHRRPPQLHV